MAGGSISCAIEQGVARVALRHDGKLNAMSRAMWVELREVFQGLATQEALRCVVVAGHASHFCAGGDISEYPSFRFDEAKLRHFHEAEVWGALQAVLDCPVPVIAQIEGNCMGAGVEIASCCDIRLAGQSARFGAPIARLGFPMAPREAALVARELGAAAARSMLFEASVWDAPQLLHQGFLTAVVADAEVPKEATQRAARVAALAPQAARLNKHTLRVLFNEGLSADLLSKAYAYADSAEHREGIEAFLAKRAPEF
ncbi:MAG: enoyl-CoA hydratase-related protein [Hydrogenophaga sp.]